MELEKIVKCKWVEASKTQIENEFKRYGHTNHSQSFYNQGCPSCDGYKIDCIYRLPKIKIGVIK